MNRTLHSNAVTFVDYTDSRKLEAYITSNLPTIQIYDTNTRTYSPNWSSTNLVLTADIYLDSKEVTDNTETIITWFSKNEAGETSQISTGKSLTINNNNVLSNNTGIITYVCMAEYQTISARKEITFTRINTGENGKDGTGVTILGSYNTLAELQAAHPTGNAGDSYIVDGDLYVWAVDDTQWENVGNIQGPKGDRGESAKAIILNASAQVFKIDKIGTVSPTTITITAQGINTTANSWTYSTNGGQTFLSTVPTGVSRSENIVTITGSSLTSNSIVIKASDGTYSDTLTIYKVFDGSDGTKGSDGLPAPIAFLTNENITFSANENGQITGTAFTTNVVAYSGTTKVTPTIGTITGLPTGMTVGSPTTLGNELILTFTIANNTTLGSALNNNGTITVPVTSPVSTNLKLSWSKVNAGVQGSKGDDGVGISSVTVTYGVSTSSETQPTSWQSTIPNVAEGSYLWTRTITDYTDEKIPDTVTYIYAKQGAKGDAGTTGSSVTVSSVQYQEGTSATVAPTGTWSNTVVAVAEGKFLWTKTVFSDGKVAYGVAKQGVSGSDAYTVMLTNESHIFAGDILNAIAGTATTQVLAYKGSVAQPVTIVSVNGKTATTTDTDTGIVGLKFKCSALSGVSPTITFTCTTSFVNKSGSIPIVLSVGGVSFTKMFTYSIAFKGTTGTPGTPASLVDITPSAYYFKSTTGKDGTFTPDYIYLYPRFQTVTFSAWQYSINGGTTWIAASGVNGLTIDTYNSVANTLRIAKTSTLYTDTVTSISFRCVSSNALVYDTVSIAKIYDVVDLQIEGRNLLLNSGIPVTNSTYNIKTYELATTPIVGETYTITLKGKLGEGKSHFSAYNSGGNVTLAALTKVGTSDLYTKTFKWTNGDRTDLDKSVFIYVMANSTVVESTIEWIKLEKGTLATDWTPAPEDYKSVTFQIYAPNGYLLTNELQSLTLQTFAYDGSIEITSGATFQWSHLVDDVWTPISGATNTTLTVAKADVLKAKSYRCVMTYKSKTYTSTITVQDKTDTYNSIMCISSNATGNDCYWVLYTLVYSDTDEVDPLLGPISINTPSSPTSGDYWYAVDPTNATVTLKKYNGTSWVNSTDTQSLSYYWDIINDGSASMPIGGSSKVKVISCHDFTGTATLVCKVNDTEDGLITQSSLSLTDVSDPIVSTTEPTGVVNGQIWIKPNANETYQMFVWDESNTTWVTSDVDTRTKVYTSRPSSYNAGDLWITATDADHGSYLQGTLLQAQTYNITYNAADWSPTLRYDQDIDSMKETLDNLSEYVSINSSGLRIGAKSNTGELSPFTSLFTSTELAFYQNSEKLLILANNQLTAPRVVVEDELEVQGSISLNDLRLVIENNGSYSFVVSQ